MHARTRVATHARTHTLTYARTLTYTHSHARTVSALSIKSKPHDALSIMRFYRAVEMARCGMSSD